MLPFTKRMVNNFDNIPGTNSSAGFVKLFLVGFFKICLGMKHEIPTEDSSVREGTPGDPCSPYRPVGNGIKEDTQMANQCMKR